MQNVEVGFYGNFGVATDGRTLIAIDLGLAALLHQQKGA